MKTFVVTTLLLTLAFGTLLFADKGRGGRGKDRAAKVVEKEEEEDEEEEVVSVLVVHGTKPFTVAAKDLVRLTGTGIAGSAASIQITGPAKLVQTATIREITNGEALIGSSKTEFDLKLKGKGAVTAVITVKFPNAAAPLVTTYNLQVE